MSLDTISKKLEVDLAAAKVLAREKIGDDRVFAALEHINDLLNVIHVLLAEAAERPEDAARRKKNVENVVMIVDATARIVGVLIALVARNNKGIADPMLKNALFHVVAAHNASVASEAGLEATIAVDRARTGGGDV